MRRWLASLLTASVLVGCSPSPSSELAVLRAWARPVSAGAALAVVYFEVTSDAPDTLTAVEVAPELADQVQLHGPMGGSSEEAGHIHGAPGGSSIGANPFSVSPDRPLVLEPGGVHAMLVEVKRDLVAGETFSASFVFSSGRRVVADVVVANNRPE